MMHGDKSPVGHNTGNANAVWGTWGRASDEVFDSSGIEEFDVRERKNFGKEGRSKESLEAANQFYGRNVREDKQ
jgi:hypothetical protein